MIDAIDVQAEVHLVRCAPYEADAIERLALLVRAAQHALERCTTASRRKDANAVWRSRRFDLDALVDALTILMR